MAEKWFGKALFCLWLSIIVLRSVLEGIARFGHPNEQILNYVYVTFSLLVLGSEVAILRRARQLFHEEAKQQDSPFLHKTRWQILSLQCLLGLMVFSLSYSLWALSGNSGALFPSFIGISVNLFLTYAWAIMLFRDKELSSQPVR